MEKEREENSKSITILEDSDIIRSLEYFKNKLKDFVNYSDKNISYDDIYEFTKNLYVEIEQYLNRLYSSDILIYKSELIDIINDMIQEQDKYINMDKPIIIDKKIYYERAVNKLMAMFSKNGIPYSSEEANEIYGNIKYLERKYNTFIELIDWVNQNGLSVCPDRIMFCAYMRITIDQYQDFLKYTNDEKIGNVFKSIENYIITLRLNAGEIGTRNSSAIKTNVSYDKVGNNLSPKDSGQTINKNLIITNEDIFNKMRKLGFSNDFEQRKTDSSVIDYTK